MKLSFENLGAIAKGEMELADLTIVCGQNNTGKTYVTYALYCLLKSWISLTRIDLSEEMKELTSEGVVKIDIEAKIVNAWPKISKAVIDNFLDAFPAMMASRSELFENTKLHWDIFIGDEWKKRAIKNELRSPQGSLLIAITKPADSVFAEIAAASPQSRGFLQGYSISEFIEEALIRIVLTDVMPDVFMASTERTGATIFRKDLNLAKNSVVDLLAQLHKDGTSDI
uniref:AAA family ATPase n=1 Tax=Nitrosomonas sp. TaxID=42353 RepID=UPI0035ADD4FE